MPGQQAGGDTEEHCLELGGIGHDAAAVHRGGTGDCGDGRAEHAAGERLGGGESLAPLSQHAHDPGRQVAA